MQRLEALELWNSVATRWNAAAAQSNVFDSWFQKMNCPSCRTLCTPGPGYPHIDISNLVVCNPDFRCLKVNRTNPVYVVDKQLYIAKLEAELFGI
jgi:hypothetical protein